MKVILSGRDKNKLKLTANKCKNETSIKPLDVANNKKVEQTSKEIIEKYTNIDVLINSAGINVEQRRLGCH